MLALYGLGRRRPPPAELCRAEQSRAGQRLGWRLGNTCDSRDKSRKRRRIHHPFRRAEQADKAALLARERGRERFGILVCKLDKWKPARAGESALLRGNTLHCRPAAALEAPAASQPHTKSPSEWAAACAGIMHYVTHCCRATSAGRWKYFDVFISVTFLASTGR